MDSDISDTTSNGVEATPIWKMIDEVVCSEGVELFDIEVPRDGGASGRSGVVRVYITKNPVGAEDTESVSERRGGVTFEDCVRVTKRLLDVDEKESFVPASCVLEVSSPGINRTLRLPAHFTGAVGERIRTKFRNAQNTYQVVSGVLRAFQGGVLEIEGDEKNLVHLINLVDVKEARVDFKF